MMRVPLSRFSLLMAVVLAGAIALAAGSLARAATEGDLPDEAEAALDVLFKELKGAKDKESADLVATAIRRSWVRSGSDTVDLLIRRASELMEARELDDALQILDAVVEIAPEFAEGWNKRATVYFMLHMYGPSIADVHQVLAIEPRHFGALAGLGTMLKDTGQDAAALEIYRRALEIHPFLEDAQKAVDELAVEVEGQDI